MKKFMMCLLSLTVILSGCIQQERPEEPSAVEENNEQLTDENLDENKINDNSQEDFNYDKIDVNNQEIENKDAESSSKDDKDNEQEKFNEPEFYEFITIKENIYKLSQSQLEILDESTINELKIQVPLMNFDNDEVENFNNKMLELYNYSMETFTYNGEDLSTALTVNFDCYLENDILSIVIYRGGFMWGSTPTSTTVFVYNYSLKDNTFLNNTELLELLGLETENVEVELSEILTKEYKKDTIVDEKTISEYNPEYENVIYYEITNDSLMYLHDGVNFILKGYIGINKHNFDIKVKMED